ASKGMPQTTASAPLTSLEKRRRMNDSAPAYVGSLSLPTVLRAVNARSMALDGMMGLRSVGPKVLDLCDAGATKKRIRRPAFPSVHGSERLALGELERTAGLCLAVLLSLDDAAV